MSEVGDSWTVVGDAMVEPIDDELNPTAIWCYVRDNYGRTERYRIPGGTGGYMVEESKP